MCAGEVSCVAGQTGVAATIAYSIKAIVPFQALFQAGLALQHSVGATRNADVGCTLTGCTSDGTWLTGRVEAVLVVTSLAL